MVSSLMLIAWLLEILIGWPDLVYKRIGHPVTWMGSLIHLFDRTLNRDGFSGLVRYCAGVLASIVVVASVGLCAIAISRTLPDTWWGYGIEAVVASSLLASRSLYQHVRQVSLHLEAGDQIAAREATARIVGRNLDAADETAMASASLESLAENTSDGVVAPLFWGVLFGLPGIATYKAINTLDSMIGHRSETYQKFGGFAARLDDLANLIPARLTGFLFAATHGRRRAFITMLRDHDKHRSPNAGWPEAAMAGALNVRLSGPRNYDGIQQDEPWLHAAGRSATAADIKAGLRLYVRALVVAAAGLSLLILGVHNA